jgi:hypothetical protein
VKRACIEGQPTNKSAIQLSEVAAAQNLFEPNAVPEEFSFTSMRTATIDAVKNIWRSKRDDLQFLSVKACLRHIAHSMNAADTRDVADDDALSYWEQRMLTGGAALCFYALALFMSVALTWFS